MARNRNESNGRSTPLPGDAVDGAEPARDDRASAKVILLTILVILLAIAVVAGLLQVFVAQQTPELTEDRLQQAQALWDSDGPASYDMDLEIRGAQPGSVHIEVRNGTVTAMTRDDHSPPERTWYVWSVPGQFETLEREIVLAEDPQHEMDVAAGAKLQLRAEFDPQFGFPRRYHRYATGGAPEVFWRVTKFIPR